MRKAALHAHHSGLVLFVTHHHALQHALGHILTPTPGLLERRRHALRTSPEPIKRRWDEFLELYVGGCTFQEIGALMHLTEGTARNWLCQIRKYLAQPVPVE